MYCTWVQKITIPSQEVKILSRPLNIEMLYLADLVPDSESAGDWENSLKNNVKDMFLPLLYHSACLCYLSLSEKLCQDLHRPLL